MTLLGGLIIGSCAFMLGIIVGGVMAGRETADLQQALKCKRDVWCGDCRHRLDSKAFDEQMLSERRSKYACLREKDKEINALKVKLYEATRQQGIAFMNRNVARG